MTKTRPKVKFVTMSAPPVEKVAKEEDVADRLAEGERHGEVARVLGDLLLADRPASLRSFSRAGTTTVISCKMIEVVM